MMPSHHLRHHLDWALVIKTLARPNIQFIRNGIQLLQAMPRQVGALGQVLPNQAVDVFVAAALPGAMRVAEVNSHSGTLGDLGVTHHFPALVIGQRLRAARGMRFKAALKPSTAEVAVASCILISIR